MDIDVPRPPSLGCIADDLTGATDLAGSLVREGMRVTLVAGVPDEPAEQGADALVVALKSRSIAAADAVAMSRHALDWLRTAGAERIFFKYASTFDSTPAGNIGPVTEALQDDLGATPTAACPAFPANGRTVVDGQLLVGGVPVSETHMRDHPLNPMRDADLRRVLGAQTTGRVGHLPHGTVASGPAAIRNALTVLGTSGVRHVIADAADTDDLLRLGTALVDEPLVTGGSALGAAIAIALRDRGTFEPNPVPMPPTERGPAAVLAGSCSAATLDQVAAMAAIHPTCRVDAAAVARGEDVVQGALAWARANLSSGPILIASSAAAGTNDRVDELHGPAIERALGEIARGLADAGVRRLIVAGGETSGAVVAALGLRILDVGPEIAPGVPWVRAREPVDLHLALKSGNFGGPDFFALALGGRP